MQISNKLVVLIIAAIFLYSFTEQKEEAPKDLGFIEVIGSAEMEIQPDEVEFEIKIIVGPHKTIEKSEKKLFKVLSEYGIPKKDVKFADLNHHNYWYYWWHDRRYDYKTFNFKISEKTDLHELVKEFHPDWVSHLRVSKTTHSKTTKYRKQVKIDAMKAAKDKAEYLLNSVGQKPGLLIEVVEINADVNQYSPYWYSSNIVSNSNRNFNSRSTPSSGTSNEMEGVKAIKLRYEIKTKFQIL